MVVENHRYPLGQDQTVDEKPSSEDEDRVVSHHHFIACKDYDRAITRKIQSSEALDHISQLNRNNEVTSKKIMIIEDDDDINFLFKMVLEESIKRLTVDTFNDPFIALENFRAGLYDLVIIDIVMPKINGFELYGKVRKLDNKVKICFTTASEMYHEEVRKQLFPELDVNCFIRKPIANEDLLRQIRGILQES